MRPKKPRRPPESPCWQVILEEIRSQNRATIETVEASRAALEERIERLEHDTRARDAGLEMAIREVGVDVRQVRADVTVLQGHVRQLQGDVKGLQGEVRSLSSRAERWPAWTSRSPRSRSAWLSGR